jgi:hypothetical protein
MEIKQISVQEIDEDPFFRFSSEKDIFQLRESVLKDGIRTPVQVIPHKGKYRLVSGFKRLSIVRQAGISQIPAEVLEESDLPDQFLSVVSEQLTTRPLTPVEKARVIGIFESLGLTTEELIHDILPILEIPSRAELFSLMKEIREYPIPIQMYIELYHVSLKNIRMFSGFSDGELRIAACIGHSLQLTPFDLSEILKLFKDIGGRESLSLDVVYKNMDFESVLMSNKTRNEKIQIIKSALQERRYPSLTTYRKSLGALERLISLPDFVQLTWDKDLEKPGVVLRATLKSFQDFQRLLEILNDQKNHKPLEQIFEML